ncbi:MAG: MFS transporter [Sphingomonadaceae bacterium]|nr:MFS transporter [Sphingomonadaceae bacterium]
MGTIMSLVLATIAFVGSHMLLSHPLRAPVVAKLGEGGFMIVYSIVALFTFGWMVWAGLAMAPMPAHWIAPLWFYDWAAPVLMLLASILLAGSFVGNPAFPDAGSGSTSIRPATGVFAITRHPMNWAIMIWALTHIALSGTPLNLTVAGGLFLLTFFGSLAQDRKKEGLMGDAWRGWEARTSFVPFKAVLDGRIPVWALWPGWIALIGGIVIWVGATWLHAMPVGIWQ